MTPIERFLALPIYPSEEQVIVTAETLMALREEFRDPQLRIGDTVTRRLKPVFVRTELRDDDIVIATDSNGVTWGRCFGMRQRILT